MQKMHLPEPDQAARQRSQQLEKKIIQAIEHTSLQYIDFAHYMKMALYEPNLGYYSSASQKFGSQGDFITAPEVSPLFAQCLANSIVNTMQEIPNAKLIEFGAGSGALAVDILISLEQHQQLPEQYFIIELSAYLQQRQQTLIKQRIPHLQHKVQWLQSLPDNIPSAIVIANEVLDAMPVQRFIIHDNAVQQIGVQFTDQLQFRNTPANTRLLQAVQTIEDNLQSPFPNGYCSEVNLFAPAWLQSLSTCLHQAAVFLIDYGYHQAEYYAAERSMGTLMCYYQHRSHADALYYPGLQDITAFVDFSAVAEAALAADFDVDGYTNQGSFLLACGLTDLAEHQLSDDIQQQLQLSQQIKTLSFPSEMGERFKVMALSKNLKKTIKGFELSDFRDRL